jgi:hypothetical protein
VTLAEDKEMIEALASHAAPQPSPAATVAAKTAVVRGRGRRQHVLATLDPVIQPAREAV